MFNSAGVIDLVPQKLREQWIADGSYPNRSVFDMFLEKAQSAGEQAAVIELEDSISYARLLDKSLRLAASLRALGIVEGDVVVYQLPNCWQCCAIDLAVAALGAVVAPLPPGRGRLDLESLLRRCSARMFIGVARYGGIDVCDIIESIRPAQLSLRFTVLLDTDSATLQARPSTTAYKHWLSLADLMSAAPLASADLPTVSPASPVRFLVSSGTESEPKLVAYSHNALLGGRGKFLQRLVSSNNNAALKRDFKGLYLVPLGSAFGSTATFGALSFLGGAIVLLAKFDPAATIRAINLLKPTHLLGVPTMFQRLMMETHLARADTSSLQALISGGAVADEATIALCQKAFACNFINLYGSADGVNCHNMPDDKPETIFHTVGRPMPSVCTIKIINEAGNELAPGQIGEIIARGPISPMQYVNAPELDRRYRNTDGWVYTGDLGSINEQGFLVLSGRKKDIIIRAGINISPAQIEQLATRHHDVVGAACVPIADSDVGHRICICLMLQKGAERLSLSSLSAFLIAQGLEVSKLPEYLRFCSQLPLNPAGKVDKKKLSQDLQVLNHSPVEQRQAS